MSKKYSYENRPKIDENVGSFWFIPTYLRNPQYASLTRFLYFPTKCKV